MQRFVFSSVFVSVALKMFCMFVFHSDHQWVIAGQVAFILKKGEKVLVQHEQSLDL